MTLKDCLEENCPAGFEHLEVVYENSWSDWEEYGAVVVFDLAGELFVQEHGYCVMATDNSFHFDPDPITPEELVELKKEWDKICEIVGYSKGD